MDVNAQVTPSLHPRNVSALEGYSDETAGAVADVLAAFSTAYEGLTNIHLARQAARENPALTEAAQILVVADYAEKRQKQIMGRIEAAYDRLTAEITDGERQLSRPLEGAAVGGLTAEIRAYVKALPAGERITFLREAARTGDTKTLSAVIGAPSYLSGVPPETSEVLTRTYHETVNPTLAKRLTVMKAAKNLINDRGILVFDEIQKAVGAKPAQVANLRAARAKAEKAFTL